MARAVQGPRPGLSPAMQAVRPPLLLLACCVSAHAGGPADWAFVGWELQDGADTMHGLTPRSPASVVFATQLPATQCEKGVLPFRTQRGDAFECCLSLQEDVEVNHGAEVLAAGGRLSPEQSSSIDTKIVNIVGGLKSPLASARKQDWWQYEFCPGRYVRQYHLSPAQHVEAEYFLGVGAPPKVECSSVARYGSKDETVKHKLSDLADETAYFAKRAQREAKQGGKNRARVEDVPDPDPHDYVALTRANTQGPWDRQGDVPRWRFTVDANTRKPFLTSWYQAGSLCDATGEPRRMQVRLHCFNDFFPADKLPDDGYLFLVNDGEKVCDYVGDLYMEWVCRMPEFQDVRRHLSNPATLAPRERMALAKQRRAEVLSSTHVRSVDLAIRDALGTPGCVQLTTDGWWTYEFCNHLWLRQYHQQEGVVVQEHFIGRGCRVNNSTDSIMGRVGRYKEKQAQVVSSHTMRTRAKIPDKPKANGFWTAHGEPGAYYFETKLYDGEVCDLTGKSRQTVLQVHCTKEGPFSLSIIETATCEYEAKLHIRSLCSLDAYRSLIEADIDFYEPKAAKIVCAPRSHQSGATTQLSSPGKETQLPVTLSDGTSV